MDEDPVQDWLRVRRELLNMEGAFTALAIKVAKGAEAEEVLRQERAVLEGMRELCKAAYAKAFPKQKV
jgi:hypothetical protein